MELVEITAEQQQALQRAQNGLAWLDEFIGSLRQKAERTKQTYYNSVKLFLEWLQAQGVSRPNALHVAGYLDSLAAAKRTPETINAYLVAIRRFFAYLEGVHAYPNIAAPVERVRQHKSLEPKKDILSIPEIQGILQQLAQDQSLEGRRNYAIIMLFTRCGLRTVEAARAKVADLQSITADLMTGEQVPVLYLQGKGYKESEKGAQKVQLPGTVHKAIKDYLAARGQLDAQAPLFCSHSHRNPGDPMPAKSVGRIIKGIFKGAGIDSPKKTAHSLRHSTAVYALQSGASLEETRQLLRHSNLSITQVYLHVLDRYGKAAPENKIDDLLNQAAI